MASIKCIITGWQLEVLNFILVQSTFSSQCRTSQQPYTFHSFQQRNK